MTAKLQGIIPIVYTPFGADGSIDEGSVRRLVNHLIKAGAHGLAAVGGGSECHKMSVEERQWLASIVIDETGGRVPVIVGVSAEDTESAVALARNATMLGAAAVFATPCAPDQTHLSALLQHYGALAEATHLPVILQDAEIMVAPCDVVALAKQLPAVQYVKEEAVGSGHRITALRKLAGDRLGILSGGAHLLDELERGALGAIPGSVGVSDLVRAYECHLIGDRDGARAAFDHFLPLSFWRSQFSRLGAKEVLRRQGIFRSAWLRDPAESPPLDEYDHRELAALMEAMGEPY
ncbi:MAG: dihydrodipicolinate synthase family protein [Candidatus Dormibacteraceae bacterium]